MNDGERDPEQRRVAVICSLEELADGRVRLRLDDGATGEGGEWVAKSHFTVREFQRAVFLDVDLPANELAEIGIALVARLAALHGHLQG